MVEKFTVGEGWNTGQGTSNASANSSQILIQTSADNTTINSTAIHIQSTSSVNAVINSTAVFLDGSTYAYPLGFTYISSGDISNVSSLDLLLYQYPEYKNFFLILAHLVNRIGTDTFVMRFSTDLGENYESGASDYQRTLERITTGAVHDTTGSTGDAEIELGETAVTNSSGFCCRIMIYDPSNVDVYTKTSFTGAHSLGASDALFYGSGFRGTAQVTDAIRISASTGNIQAGEWRLYGIN